MEVFHPVDKIVSAAADVADVPPGDQYLAPRRRNNITAQGQGIGPGHRGLGQQRCVFLRAGAENSGTILTKKSQIFRYRGEQFPQGVELPA